MLTASSMDLSAFIVCGSHTEGMASSDSDSERSQPSYRGLNDQRYGDLDDEDYPPPGGARIEPLEPGSDVLLDWSSAVQLAETLLFYIRGFVEPEGSDEQADAVPSPVLLQDQGQRAARAQHLLPMSVLNAAQDRFDET